MDDDDDNLTPFRLAVCTHI